MPAARPAVHPKNPLLSPPGPAHSWGVVSAETRASTGSRARPSEMLYKRHPIDADALLTQEILPTLQVEHGVRQKEMLRENRQSQVRENKGIQRQRKMKLLQREKESKQTKRGKMMKQLQQLTPLQGLI
ncbi:hypothetical protein D9C73_010161 [Collichthys lucidus]|uniref:Uncharacterized protein n=1 Tax=Collichthys lucidus TaxID=240159 RepID=A0A4U5UMK3_COLLU|nr:hypothetical protein D9C73_010161 [Collichthys lucidus]